MSAPSPILGDIVLSAIATAFRVPDRYTAPPAAVPERARRTFASIREEYCNRRGQMAVENASDCVSHCPGQYGHGHLNGHGEAVDFEAYRDAKEEFDAAVVRYRAAMAVPGAAEDAGFAAVGDDDLADWVTRAVEAEGV